MVYEKPYPRDQARFEAAGSIVARPSKSNDLVAKAREFLVNAPLTGHSVQARRLKGCLFAHFCLWLTTWAGPSLDVGLCLASEPDTLRAFRPGLPGGDSTTRLSSTLTVPPQTSVGL